METEHLSSLESLIVFGEQQDNQLSKQGLVSNGGGSLLFRIGTLCLSQLYLYSDLTDLLIFNGLILTKS